MIVHGDDEDTNLDGDIDGPVVRRGVFSKEEEDARIVKKMKKVIPMIKSSCSANRDEQFPKKKRSSKKSTSKKPKAKISSKSKTDTTVLPVAISILEPPKRRKRQPRKGNTEKLRRVLDRDEARVNERDEIIQPGNMIEEKEDSKEADGPTPETDKADGKGKGKRFNRKTL